MELASGPLRRGPGIVLKPGLLRVVVTGSECTGKTTLTQLLAEHFAAPWVAEHARTYAAAKVGPLDASDVDGIARGQLAAEERAAGTASVLLLLDTDLVSTLVYAEHYYGTRPSWVRSAAQLRRAHLYLLCHPDVPWVADGIRDRPQVREEIHRRFVATLAELAAPVQAICGDWAQRRQLAITAVEALLRRAPPRRPPTHRS